MGDANHRVGDVIVADCSACRQKTNIQLRERKSMMGLRRERYWACERCGNRQDKPA